MKKFLQTIAAVMLIAAGPAQVTVYEGGPIITMAADSPETVEAIAVSAGKIIALGSKVQVGKVSGRKARRVDLKGQTLLPGFIDAHGHVSYVGQSENMAKLAPPPVGQVSSISELQQRLRDWIAARKIPPAAPVVGNGYDDSQLVERRHPTRKDLDAVATDRPIVIIHASGHLASLNSAALAKFGFTADTPDPQGGVIRREADGKTPNGVLEEAAIYRPIAAALPASIDDGVKALVLGQTIYIANGITTAQDGLVAPEQWPALAEAAKRGLLPIDTVALIAGMRDWPPEVRSAIGKNYSGRVRIAGIKLVLDGSPQGRTAWLHDPVTVPPPGKGADYRGYPAIDLRLFNQRLADAAASGWQVFVHVNGDEAAQALIDGVRNNGLVGRRTIAIHNQVVRPEQLADMKALDIQPSFFANHTWYWGDWHRDVALGPKRADFISPQASAWAIGLRPTAHNDSPVVPPNMLRLIWSSVNRRTQSGDILGPLERISVYRALQQVTINAAWQIHEEAGKGSLELGKKADFVVLDANPLSTDPAELYRIKVRATIKDGVTIYGDVQ